MNKKINWRLVWAILLGMVVGAALGLLIEALWDHYVHQNKPAIFAIVGAGVGLLIVIVYRWFFSSPVQLAIESIEVPLFGAKLKVRVSDDLGVVGWRLFVELATRVTTQPLSSKDGVLREAFSSLHSLFGTMRTELKAATPGGRRFNENEDTVQTLRAAKNWNPSESPSPKTRLDWVESRVARICSKAC